MNRLNKIIFFLACVYLGGTYLLFSLVGPINTTPGLKYIENYSPHKDSVSQPQNWAVLQDQRGIIYIANQGGILEFDGVSWRLIDVPNRSVRSLAMDATGILYIGGENEIGYLAPNVNGSPMYVSLKDYLTDDKKNFSTVWYTHSNLEGIYFMTSKYLFRWNPGPKHMEIWEPSSSFRSAFICNNTLFIEEKNAGLMEMKKNALQPVPGCEALAGANVEMLVPYDSRTLLIGTRAKGFYLYVGKTCIPFPTGADDYLAEKVLYQGIRLSTVPGEFAAATLRGGLVIFDANGQLKQIYDKASGLQDDSIMYVFEEPRGNLWLALSKGITLLEYASPVSVYDDRTGLNGIVLAVSITKPAGREMVYAGTTVGLFKLAPPYIFHPVPGIPGACWSLLPYSSGLLAAANDGVYWVETSDNTVNPEQKTAHKILDIPSYVLHRSSVEPNRTWVGTANGLASLYLNSTIQKPGNHWHLETVFKNITDPIKTIVEDKKGNLWMGTWNRGIIKAAISTLPRIAGNMITHYNASHGLPAGGINVFIAAGHVIFASEKGLYRYDETGDRFIPDVTLGITYAAEGRQVFRIVEDQHRDIWFHSRSRNYRAILKPGSLYDVDNQPFPGIPPAQTNAIYPGPDGKSMWFASVDGLFRIDTTMKKNCTPGFSTYIRKVIINGKHPIFDGSAERVSAAPTLEYQERNPHFYFAAPFFESKSQTLYQCILEGYDKDWTAWTIETRKEYTNLDAGQYTFRVRAKNVYGAISKEDSFRFKVLPPWYRTWWAYLSYTLTAFLIMYLVVRWRSRKLAQEKQKLEQIIEERTEKINDQKQQLLEQAEKLKGIDKVKSRFFANISHEFRTPLTLILGPLEQMLAASRDKKEQKQLTMMQRNSQRLLGLINQLLELSKFDSGKVKLQASRQNIIPFLKGIVSSFETAAAASDLDLTFQSEEMEIELYLEPVKMENVMVNLLINAVKFTPSGGKITVSAKKNPGQENNFPLGSVEITVCDTGPGIPQDQLSYIFDRFYQADTTHEHLQKGSGIGLAIAKEMVELHHGTIEVHSHEDRDSGTEFIIRLPLGNAHLEANEIVETSHPPSPDKIRSEVTRFEQWEIEAEDMDTDEDTGIETGIDIDLHGKDIILVVEDSADVREYIKGTLEPSFRVVEAADGREGMEKARDIIPDLIISDIMMPGKDGYELCRELKSQRDTSHIPIILLTAKAAEENIIEGLETGADDYITKPFNTKILCARIKNLIDLRRQWQETMQREMTFKPVQKSVSQIDKEFVKDLQEVINKNIADPEFNVEHLSKRLYMGRTTLYRKILALTGEPPTEFIRSYRLKQAAELLKRSKSSVLEVALDVGFASANYFTKCFKKKFHQLPSEYHGRNEIMNYE